MNNKSSLIVIAILIIAFGSYVYNFPPSTTVSEGSTNTKSSSEQKGPRSVLRMGLIREMVNDYRKVQLASIENSTKNPIKNDAHSILFDLDTLQQFIDDIKKGVMEIDPNLNPKLAIRMYYAAYPKLEKWTEPGYHNLKNLLGDDITKEYQQKHTLIMIPVIQNSKGIFADFNPFDKSTYEGFPRVLNKKMSFAPNSTDTTDIPGLNHGQLIPPKSHDGEEF